MLSDEDSYKLKMDHVGQNGMGLVTQFKKHGDRMIVCPNDALPVPLQQQAISTKQPTLDSWFRQKSSNTS